MSTPTPSQLEDAVLTLLGEQEIEPDEVTAPDWGKLEKLDQTKDHVPTRARGVPVFHFAKRRCPDELPWVELLDGCVPSR